MSANFAFGTGKGAGKRRSHVPPVASINPASGTHSFVVQAAQFQDPHYPFQPLPAPNGSSPFRFDLSQLLSQGDIDAIKSGGLLTCHTVGDTGDFRGQQQDFVAEMMTQDATQAKPAFMYHLGDVVYFAGDIDMYGANFYETYKNYPAFIVSIPGNHDCQPDDPQDGPVNPDKTPLDGWVQNFMSKNSAQLGSLKTDAGRTQLDLPNVYWTFTTPLATFIGLFSNVGESQGEIREPQISWFKGELAAADPDLPLIVAVHHPPFSGDVDHSGSSAIYKVLFDNFAAANRYPDLILSGHVHNYQRFTHIVQDDSGNRQIPCIVVGNGGYTKLGKLTKLDGVYPTAPLQISGDLTLEEYDQDNFGFLRLEISKSQIVGTYFSDTYVAGGTPEAKKMDSFKVDLAGHTVQTLA